jgi:hypothetical protein
MQNNKTSTLNIFQYGRQKVVNVLTLRVCSRSLPIFTGASTVLVLSGKC